MQKGKKLLSKFLHGKASEKEREEVESWLDNTAGDNKEWEQLNDAERDGLLKHILEDVKSSIASNRSSRKRIFAKVGGAAAMLILLLMIPLLYLWDTPSDNPPLKSVQRTVTVKAATGEIKEIVLRDGSKVWLNARSQLSYPENFEGVTRDVKLLGQAFFDIARDPKKPFVVHGQSLTIKVLGTSFDISDYEEDKNAYVAVLSGKVAAQDTKKINGLEILDKGERMSLSKARHSIVRSAFKAENLPAWLNKEVVFYHTTMSQVANYLNRNFNVQVRFSDKRMEELEVSGDFGKIENMENLLNMICLTINADFKILGNDVVIKPLD